MHLVKDKKEILIVLLIVFIIILGSFNYHIYSTCFHGSLIKRYSDNPNYLEIDRNVIRYITGLSSKLNADFDENEKSHMADVRRIILFEEFVFIALLIWFFILAYKRKINLNQFKKAALIVFLIALFSLIASLFFNRFFELFHLIVFPQGNWQFSANSLMIQIYQQSFFQEFFVRVIAVAFIFLLLLILLIKIVKKVNHQH